MEDLNYSIQATTLKEAEKIITRLHSLGFKWRYGPSKAEALYWRDCKDKTRYFTELGYIVVGHISWKGGLNMITCDEFLEQTDHVKGKDRKQVIHKISETFEHRLK